MEKVNIQGLKDKYKGLRLITWDTLSTIHLQTARVLAKEGLNLRLQTPEIKATEDKLNEIWLVCLKGTATLDDFKDINRQWAEVIRQADSRSKKERLF